MDIATVGIEFTWRRLGRLCQQLAADPRSATYRSVAGPLVENTLQVMLLARLVHAAEVANYMRTAANWDSKKQGALPDPPEPPRLPGDPEPATRPDAEITVHDLRAWRERHSERRAG